MSSPQYSHRACGAQFFIHPQAAFFFPSHCTKATSARFFFFLSVTDSRYRGRPLSLFGRPPSRPPNFLVGKQPSEFTALRSLRPRAPTTQSFFLVRASGPGLRSLKRQDLFFPPRGSPPRVSSSLRSKILRKIFSRTMHGGRHLLTFADLL